MMANKRGMCPECGGRRFLVKSMTITLTDVPARWDEKRDTWDYNDALAQHSTGWDAVTDEEIECRKCGVQLLADFDGEIKARGVTNA